MAENAEYNQQVQEGIELDELLHGIVANLDSDSDRCQHRHAEQAGLPSSGL